MLCEGILYDELNETVALIESSNSKEKILEDDPIILVRNKITLWIWKIMLKIGVSKRTIFQTIDLFDSVIENFDLDVENLSKELQIISLVSMVISSKFQESNHIGYDLIMCLSKNTIKKEEFLNMEKLIILSTPVKVDFFEEFAYLVVKILHTLTSSKETYENTFRIIKKCNLIRFHAVKYYSFLRKWRRIYLYFSVIYLSLNNYSKCVKESLISDIFCLAKLLNLKKKSLINSIEELEIIIA
jgi:hypothetical protein